MRPFAWLGAATLLGGALLAGQGAAAQTEAGIALQHRSAESLLPVLQPLAAPAVLGGNAYRLLARGTTVELARVRVLVREADHDPALLSLSLSDQAPEGGPGAGDRTPPPADDRSVTLSTGAPLPADPHGNAQVLGTSASPRPDAVTEGELLRVSMPATQSLRFRTRPLPGATPPGGAGAGTAAVGGGTVFFEAKSDFTLRLWRVGRLVAVQVQPLQAGQVSGAITENTAPPAAAPVIFGPLDRWFALADSGRPIGAAAPAAERTGLWIRVQAP